MDFVHEFHSEWTVIVLSLCFFFLHSTIYCFFFLTLKCDAVVAFHSLRWNHFLVYSCLLTWWHDSIVNFYLALAVFPWQKQIPFFSQIQTTNTKNAATFSFSTKITIFLTFLLFLILWCALGKLFIFEHRGSESKRFLHILFFFGYFFSLMKKKETRLLTGDICFEIAVIHKKQHAHFSARATRCCDFLLFVC